MSPVIRLGAPGKQSLQVTGRGQARVLAARRWGRGSLPTPLAHPVVSAGGKSVGYLKCTISQHLVASCPLF